MTRILLWIEPHPIRGQHDGFFDHAVFLAEALLLLGEAGVSFALFSNTTVLDRLTLEYPAAAPFLVRPTSEESAWLDRQAGAWDETRKAAWLDVVAGRGDAGAGHMAMARRVIAETAPDAVILWSDNGGVRRAAAEAGLPAFSCELGPTRAPFPPTFYIDPAGTNGLAAMRACRLNDIAALSPKQSEAMRRRSPATATDFARLRDLSRDTPRPAWAPPPPYALVPLQLADDLNTLLHAPFPDPRAFLQAVLPGLLDTYDRVAVKGHPGVAGRPGNAVLQDSALDYAASLGDRVFIVPDRLPPDEQSWLLANAETVCALNSSVAFEALLLDRPVVILGDAAFDLDATLKRPADRLATPADAEARRLLRDATLGLFLHGMNAYSAGTAILDAIARAPAGTTDRRWCDSAIAALDAPVSATLPPPGTCVDDRAQLAGYIEHVEERGTQAGSVTLRIMGWVHDSALDRPVRRIAIVSDDQTLAETRSAAPRPDVARSLRSRTVSLGFDLTLTCRRELWDSAILQVEDASGQSGAFAIVAGRLIARPMPATGRCRPRPSASDGKRLGRLARRVQRLAVRFDLITGGFAAGRR